MTQCELATSRKARYVKSMLLKGGRKDVGLEDVLFSWVSENKLLECHEYTVKLIEGDEKESRMTPKRSAVGASIDSRTGLW